MVRGCRWRFVDRNMLIHVSVKSIMQHFVQGLRQRWQPECWQEATSQKVLAFLPSKQTHNRICSRSAHQQEPRIFLSAQSHFCCSALPFSHIITLSTTVLGILFFCWGSCVDLPPPWLTSVRVFSANGTHSTWWMWYDWAPCVGTVFWP